MGAVRQEKDGIQFWAVNEQIITRGRYRWEPLRGGTEHLNLEIRSDSGSIFVLARIHR